MFDFLKKILPSFEDDFIEDPGEKSAAEMPRRYGRVIYDPNPNLWDVAANINAAALATNLTRGDQQSEIDRLKRELDELKAKMSSLEK